MLETWLAGWISLDPLAVVSWGSGLGLVLGRFLQSHLEPVGICWGMQGSAAALHGLAMGPTPAQVHGRVGWDEEELHSAQPELMNPH